MPIGLVDVARHGRRAPYPLQVCGGVRLGTNCYQTSREDRYAAGYPSMTTRTSPWRSVIENVVTSPWRVNSNESRESPTRRFRHSRLFSHSGRTGLFTVTRPRSARAEMPSIDWSRRKGLPAAQACGEQATGYLTGVAGVRRVK